MSRPIVDGKGRRRCKTVAFRISPEEAKQLDLKVALSGLSKQDYITKCLLESNFTVSATVRMRKALREQVGLIVAELRRIRSSAEMPDELLESLEALSSFAGSFTPEESPVEAQDMLIKNLGRPKGTGHTNGKLREGTENPDD